MIRSTASVVRKIRYNLSWAARTIDTCRSRLTRWPAKVAFAGVASLRGGQIEVQHCRIQREETRQSRQSRHPREAHSFLIANRVGVRTCPEAISLLGGESETRSSSALALPCPPTLPSNTPKSIQAIGEGSYWAQPYPRLPDWDYP